MYIHSYYHWQHLPVAVERSLVLGQQKGLKAGNELARVASLGAHHFVDQQASPAVTGATLAQPLQQSNPEKFCILAVSCAACTNKRNNNGVPDLGTLHLKHFSLRLKFCTPHCSKNTTKNILY